MVMIQAIKVQIIMFSLAVMLFILIAIVDFNSLGDYGFYLLGSGGIILMQIGNKKSEKSRIQDK